MGIIFPMLSQRQYKSLVTNISSGNDVKRKEIS